MSRICPQLQTSPVISANGLRPLRGVFAFHRWAVRIVQPLTWGLMHFAVGSLILKRPPTSSWTHADPPTLADGTNPVATRAPHGALTPPPPPSIPPITTTPHSINSIQSLLSNTTCHSMSLPKPVYLTGPHSATYTYPEILCGVGAPQRSTWRVQANREHLVPSGSYGAQLLGTAGGHLRGPQPASRGRIASISDLYGARHGRAEPGIQDPPAP